MAKKTGVKNQVVAGIMVLVLLIGTVFGIGWGFAGTPNVTKWGKSPSGVNEQDHNDETDTEVSAVPRSMASAEVAAEDDDPGIETYASVTTFYSAGQDLEYGTKLLGSISTVYDYDEFTYTISIKIPYDNTSRCIKQCSLKLFGSGKTDSGKDYDGKFSFGYTSSDSLDVLNYDARFYAEVAGSSGSDPILSFFEDGEYYKFPKDVAKLGLWELRIELTKDAFCFRGYTYGGGNYSWWRYKNDTPEYAFIRGLLLNTETKVDTFSVYDNISDYTIGDFTLTESISVYTSKPVVPLPEDPVKEGYTFVGWYLDSGFRTLYDRQTVYQDTQLYAKFEINKFTVTFNSNGGSVVASQTVNWNTVATLTIPNRTGYTFQGWYLPNGEKYENQAITKDVTLTAQWEIMMCTVKFYVNGNLYHTVKVEYGTILSAVQAVAGENYLNVISVDSDSPDFSSEGLEANGITTDINVTAEEKTGFDKFIYVIKNNKWVFIGCAVGIVAFIAIVVGVVAVQKRKEK